MLVLVNNATRFVVAVYQVKKKDLKNIEKIIIDAIEHTLLAMNLNPEIVKEYGEPDEVKPVTEPNINVDQFFAMDLRVCKILKCQEIRKSHSNYKLTLFDGLKERVIVSSIKNEYKPEELEGKKIIVVANLEPARLTGVTSEGMLLAATNNACGCQVIFVDDIVPEGTRIC